MSRVFNGSNVYHIDTRPELFLAGSREASLSCAACALSSAFSHSFSIGCIPATISTGYCVREVTRALAFARACAPVPSTDYTPVAFSGLGLGAMAARSGLLALPSAAPLSGPPARRKR